MTLINKIYTKTGDKGETGLVTGTRVKKYNLRLEAYGTVDELNSHLGLIQCQEISSDLKDFLLRIQNKLFNVGSLLSKDKETTFEIPEIKKSDIQDIENEIDKMQAELPPLRNFILPGGHPVVAYCHIARTICRRAERLIVKLSEQAAINNELLIYINRLSDYLFVLSRKIAKDLNVNENTWKK